VAFKASVVVFKVSEEVTVHINKILGIQLIMTEISLIIEEAEAHLEEIEEEILLEGRSEVGALLEVAGEVGQIFNNSSLNYSDSIKEKEMVKMILNQTTDPKRFIDIINLLDLNL
jgi:hypothetical protein